jgi:hypothetical protein
LEKGSFAGISIVDSRTSPKRIEREDQKIKGSEGTSGE